MDYQNTVLLNKIENNIYDSLTKDVSQWWSNDFSGMSQNTGDEFEVRFGSTFKRFKVAELVINKRIVWLCMDSYIDAPGLTKKDEWKGTRIVWEIDETTKPARVFMQHKGLTPVIDCYTLSEKNWDFFLTSLTNHISLDEAHPFKAQPYIDA